MEEHLIKTKGPYRRTFTANVLAKSCSLRNFAHICFELAEPSSNPTSPNVQKEDKDFAFEFFLRACVTDNNGCGNEGHQVPAGLEGAAAPPLPEVGRQRRRSRVRREALHSNQDGQPQVPDPDPRVQRHHSQAVGQVRLRPRRVHRPRQQEGRTSSGRICQAAKKLNRNNI